MDSDERARLIRRIEELELALSRSEKVKRTLMDRVEQSTAAHDSSFASFERNILLQQAIDARTAELGEVNRRLREEIAIRERIEEDLAHSRDEALRAASAKSEFVANMSHEVRTPMNGILGMVELLLRTQLDQRQRDYARTIKRSADALLAILDDILDFSRIEAGKLVIEQVGFDLVGTVTDVTRLLTPRAIEKGLTLELSISPEVPARLVGDAGRIRQVLTNLAGNAVKFTERGGVSVEVTCPAQSEASASIAISVIDSGIGVPKDRLDAIFERFTQADSSTTRKHGGTGLGLTISRHLVELMGGRLRVTSEPGRGSVFTFELELPLELPTDPREPRPSSTLDLARPGAAPRRVLLVEDNEVNRIASAHLLAELGCETHVAASGEEALAMTAVETYDVVFMDCQMPDMDGYETTARIRAREAGQRRIPIVAFTASAMAGTRERCLAAGMDDYVTKPVTLAGLARVLGIAVLERPSSPPVAAPKVSSPEDPPIFDVARARELAMNDEDLLKFMFTTFLDDAPRRVENLRAAWTRGDAKTVEREAHTLKSASANIGGARLRAAAAAVEEKVEAGLTVSDADLARIEAALGELCPKLQQPL